MIENNLEGQIALVTGGTRGIGKNIVENLLKSGASVIMTGTSPHYDVSGFKISGDQKLSYKQLD
ncbi:MAG: SDR family NAD(P)-dependent oxidoreductase, partial [Candidatus Marinimicrobia bacterium]|nr:SDR family NAD(P)-dependent oxidoreductase [Candidatus Neomarinimicrobiota bacterium]